LRVRLKLVVLKFASHIGVTKACREFEVPRSSFYRWKQNYEKAGQSGLYRERPVAYGHPRRTSPEVVEKILELRTEYQFGAYASGIIWSAIMGSRFHNPRSAEY
jgi:transposase-like protein